MFGHQSLIRGNAMKGWLKYAVLAGALVTSACVLDGVRETLVGDDGKPKVDTVTVVVHDTVYICKRGGHHWECDP
jgi:hypothetical protein